MSQIGSVTLPRWRRVCWMLGACGALAACAPVQAPIRNSDGLVGPEPSSPPRAPELPLATDEELAIEQELRREVAALVELGPRSLGHSWNLYSSTDHLARRLELEGFEVRRQGFAVGEEVVQNLEVSLPGEREGEVWLVAHYDSAGDSLGANASASGSAALLVLARRLKGRRFAHPVRLVWLALEGQGTGSLGSREYARFRSAEHARVRATLTLGSLGYYCEESGCQRYPEELLYGSEGRRPWGDFLSLVSNAASHALFEFLTQQAPSTRLPVEGLVLPEDAALSQQGPQASFWEQGWPGVLLSDTATLRDAELDGPKDSAERIDFARLARAVAWLDPALEAVAGRPSPVPHVAAEGVPSDQGQPAQP